MKRVVNRISVMLFGLIVLLSCKTEGESNDDHPVEFLATKTKVSGKIINVNNVDIFYREAGVQHETTILLLHGWPSSSHMYRNLMDTLSEKYHVIAPDYPAFGLSEAPAMADFEYTFDNFSVLIEAFIDTLSLSSFYLYIQDYGGPVGMRVVHRRPELIQGLIIQNANSYVEGLGEWAQKIGGFVQAGDFEGLNAYREYLISPEGIKSQYQTGAKEPSNIDPVSYLTDAALIQRTAVKEAQTAVFNDYGNNIPKYAQWQGYLREYKPPTLIVWGTGDKFFNVNGAKAYLNDLPEASIHMFDGGHFLLEEYTDEVSQLIENFIQ